MNYDIKVGDKIKCVYANHLNTLAFRRGMLTFGKIYTILYIGNEFAKRVQIKLDTGTLTFIYMIYDKEVWFEKVEDTIEEKELNFLDILKGY